MFQLVFFFAFLFDELGLVKLPSKIYVLLFLFVIFAMLIKWIMTSLPRKINDIMVKRLLILVSTFILYECALIIGTNQGSDSILTTTLQFRLVSPLLCFIYIITFVDSEKKFKMLVIFLLLSTILGVFLSILHALEKDSALMQLKYYSAGHSANQDVMKVGSLRRTMLPSLYLIEPCLIVMICGFLLTRKIWMLVFSIILTPGVLFGYARSHWLGLACSVFICFFLITQYVKKYLGKRTEILFQLTVVGVLTFVIFSSFTITGNDLSQKIAPITDRIIKGVDDVSGDQGTFGSRMNTTDVAFSMWLESPIFGKGPYFMNITRWYQLSDVGVVYTLVTLGIVGLILFLIIIVYFSYCGFITFKEGLSGHNLTQALLGISLFAVPLFITIALQTTQTMYLLASLFTLAGMTIQYRRIIKGS